MFKSYILTEIFEELESEPCPKIPHISDLEEWDKEKEMRLAVELLASINSELKALHKTVGGEEFTVPLPEINEVYFEKNTMMVMQIVAGGIYSALTDIKDLLEEKT